MTAPGSETNQFALERPLTLYPLTYLEQGDEVTIGCAHTESYAVLSADGAQLLRWLDIGLSPHEAAQRYTAAYGEPVDIVEFLEALTELEFLADAGTVIQTLAPVRWQRLGQIMFGSWAWLCYAGLVAVTLWAMLAYPRVRPTYHHVFFSPYMTVIVLTLLAGQLVTTAIHEAFHALAGRRLGLRSTFSVGRRLHFVVFQTTLDGLVSIPRRKRYLPILAGLVADCLMACLLTLTAVVIQHGDGSMSVVSSVCLGIAFATFLRMAWQFYFFLETDLYYLVVTVTGCVDLQNTARRMLANRFWWLLRRRDLMVDENSWYPRDRTLARWYSWLLLVGYTFLIAMLLTAGLPALGRVLHIMVGRFSDSGLSWGALVDSALFIALNIANFVVIAVVAIRDRRRRRRFDHVLH